jgi:hypothetical protein
MKRWRLRAFVALVPLAAVLVTHWLWRDAGAGDHRAVAVSRLAAGKVAERSAAGSSRTTAHAQGGAPGPGASDAAGDTSAGCVTPAEPDLSTEEGQREAAAHGERRMADVAARLSRSPDARARALAALFEPDAQRRLEATEGTAGAAVGMTDPVLYQIALDACRRAAKGDVPASCGRLSLARWAQIEPDNAAVWLEVAADAAKAHDRQGMDEAMFRASVAPRIDSRWGGYSAIVLRAMGDEVGEGERLQALVAAVGVQAAGYSGGGFVLSRYCKLPLDANRRQVCERIATLMTTKATTYLDLGFGNAVGKRLGWPQERTQALADRMAGLQSAMTSMMLPHDAAEAKGCALVRRQMRYFRRIASEGEIAASELAVKDSGRSLQAWAASAASRP